MQMAGCWKREIGEIVMRVEDGGEDVVGEKKRFGCVAIPFYIVGLPKLFWGLK